MGPVAMRSLDHDYVEEVMARLGRIQADAQPAWGALTRDRLVAHLVGAVRFSMGRLGAMPDQGTWFTRRIMKPLVLNGIVRIPKNVRTRGAARQTPGGIDNLETLHALLEEYLQLVQADELTPPPHPIFGPLDVDEWAKMHVRHFEHHLRQFGV